MSLEWHYILSRLVTLQTSGRKKLCIVKNLSELDITNRIMRKENYMISIFNLDILQIGPWNERGEIEIANPLKWILGHKGGTRATASGAGGRANLDHNRKILRERGAGQTGTASTIATGNKAPTVSPPASHGIANPNSAATSSSSLAHPLLQGAATTVSPGAVSSSSSSAAPLAPSTLRPSPFSEYSEIGETQPERRRGGETMAHPSPLPPLHPQSTHTHAQQRKSINSTPPLPSSSLPPPSHSTVSPPTSATSSAVPTHLSPTSGHPPRLVELGPSRYLS